MNGTFSGWTSEHYATYRRDLPEAAVSQLVEHFGLSDQSCVLDLGSGTGQVVVPLARRVGYGVALEPEPDLLRRLRVRPDLGTNVLAVLGSDRDLPLLRRVIGDRRIDLLTVANALHFMDAASVFDEARALLRPGGGIAIVSHGLPLWLADTDWARAVNRFLADWLDTTTGGLCGLDDQSRQERAALLATAGFIDITVLRHDYSVELSPDYVVGHIYSALSEAQVPADRRADFESGLRSAMERNTTGAMIEHVPVVTLAARTPN